MRRFCAESPCAEADAVITTTELKLIENAPITRCRNVPRRPRGALFGFGRIAKLPSAISQFPAQGALDQVELDLCR
jgi:hypothetical protein